jgi:hypothetical protein
VYGHCQSKAYLTDRGFFKNINRPFVVDVNGIKKTMTDLRYVLLSKVRFQRSLYD